MSCVRYVSVEMRENVPFGKHRVIPVESPRWGEEILDTHFYCGQGMRGLLTYSNKGSNHFIINIISLVSELLTFLCLKIVTYCNCTWLTVWSGISPVISNQLAS